MSLVPGRALEHSSDLLKAISDISSGTSAGTSGDQPDPGLPADSNHANRSRQLTHSGGVSRGSKWPQWPEFPVPARCRGACNVRRHCHSLAPGPCWFIFHVISPLFSSFLFIFRGFLVVSTPRGCSLAVGRSGLLSASQLGRTGYQSNLVVAYNLQQPRCLVCFCTQQSAQAAEWLCHTVALSHMTTPKRSTEPTVKLAKLHRDGPGGWYQTSAGRLRESGGSAGSCPGLTWLHLDETERWRAIRATAETEMKDWPEAMPYIAKGRRRLHYTLYVNSYHL